MRSLKQQILLLVTLMVLGTVVASSIVAALQFERILRQDAVRQTESIAVEIAALLGTAAADALEQAGRARSLIADETEPRRWRNALAAFVASDPNLIGAAIWRPDSAARILVDGPAADSTRTVARIARATPDSTGVGPIRTLDSLHFYDITLPLWSDTTRPERLIMRRRISSAEMVRLVGELAGTPAALLLGVAENQWSDLTRTVPAPETEADTEYRWKADSIYDGVTVRVANTPWQLWVGLPRAKLAAPTRLVVTNIAGAGLVILVLAAIAATMLVRRIVAPLDNLNLAMATIASGQHRLRVPEDGPAEILRLSENVNAMADRIEEGTDRLEHLVEQRTRELESALAELREVQQQLGQNERLATLGQLASVIGQELRNPLRAMTNAIYYLEMMSHNASPAVKENYGILRYQILVAEKIVADLIDFAQTRPPEKERVDVRELIDEQMNRLGKPNGVSLKREYHPATPAALVDPIQIGQAIFNVLTNAVQALEGGGTVVVRAFGADGHIRIEITDSGPGIAPEDLPRIFEPLFSKRSRGVGLGLSVARGLVEANGGSIDVESESGSGATFSIQLPPD